MQKVIVRGFVNVLRFSGRDTRAQFWPFAGVAVALYLVVGWLVLTPLIWGAIGGPSENAPEALMDSVGPFLVGSLAMFVALIGLLAAAVARRLHDAGRSALWGLLPLPFVAYSGTMFFRVFSQFQGGAPDMGLFLSVFVSNVLYMVCVVTLIVLLAARSAPGENRYGRLETA